MLNELYQAAKALEARHVPIIVPHSAVEPMGKSELLLIRLDNNANPIRVNLVPREIAGMFVRVAHGSEGSSFPGFNLPLPLRVIPQEMDVAKLKRLVELQQSKEASAAPLAEAIRLVFSETSPVTFSTSQIDQFRRSMQELVGWLKADCAKSGPELENFRTLLDVIAKAKPELPSFIQQLSICIECSVNMASRDELVEFADILFGKTYLTKCKDEVASEAYWRAKKSVDDKLHKPVFFDVAEGNPQALPVANPQTSRVLNQFLLNLQPLAYDACSRKAPTTGSRRKKSIPPSLLQAKDAYTGNDCVIPNKFPEPKLAILGNTKLFSNNTAEAACFFRYGLGDTETFKVSWETVKKMSGTLFTLAGDDLALTALGGRPSLGKTCRSIPGNRSGKQDLLVAYLENEPNASDPFVELFGNKADTYDIPDFAASVKPVLDALEGRVAANPNQLIHLIAISAVDQGNKQLSLNRNFTVSEVLHAAKAWQKGAANCPPVRMPFFDKHTKKVVPKTRTMPSPLEMAIVLNKVWSSSSEGGFKADFHRILSVSDAYDIFLAPDPIKNAKTQFAFQMVLTRMRDVFAAAGKLKVTSDFKVLNEPTRWQVLKAVALIGIFLRQLDQQHEVFMKESIYQVGRLLALADSLHFQYCKWVRTSEEKQKKHEVDAPSELLGNALFNTALDGPIVALARLAERIRPYKGWADTYSGEDAGLVHWFVRQMAECEKQVDLNCLPQHMQDVHKAQLLLGYLADSHKAENEK